MMSLNDTTIATIRTTVNSSYLTAAAAVLYKLFGWDVKVEDLLPFMPIIVPAIAVFYRLSLYIGTRWPTLGTILFGVQKKPTY
jgi:hypothetical protein